MAQGKQVGVSLPPECYDRLLALADAHRWKPATAARIIICDHLDAIEAKEEEERVT